jgi:hypothetical protein
MRNETPIAVFYRQKIIITSLTFAFRPTQTAERGMRAERQFFNGIEFDFLTHF